MTMSRTHSFARTAVLVTALAAVAVPTVLPAQFFKRDTYGRIPRRHVLPFVGMAVAGAASSIVFISKPRSLSTLCQNPTCILGASLTAGAFVGWLVGREKDMLHDLRYRGGRPLYATASSVALAGEPVALSVDRDVAVSGGLGGVSVVLGGPRLQQAGVRAAALRGINDVALSVTDSLLGIVAGGGFYRFPLLAGQGTLLRGGPPATAVVLSPRDFIVATGSRVERVPRSTTDPAAGFPGADVSDTVRALRVDSRGVTWAVTNTSLIALETVGDSLRVASESPLPRGARRLSIDGMRLAVAAGDSGVVFFDISSPARPTIQQRWTETRFAYDIALTPTRAFIAAGIDGVSVLAIDGRELRFQGLARELGFIVSIAVEGNDLWVLDRSGTAALRKTRTDIDK
jgi:hypothetical protein